MAWIVEDRRKGYEKRAEPYLTDDMKIDIGKKYFPRYPTKRAVLLPALHAIQHAYGWIPMQAIEEVAAFLEISPAEALDTATFYEEYWLKPKGKYLLQVCRSLACEICGSRAITDHLKKKLRIEAGETTADGKFTLVELECLGSCGTAPAALVNEVLHENVTTEQIDRILETLPDDPHEYKDPTVNWNDSEH
jgi:NADH-quinone oxidoreductase subunit E